MWHDAHLLCVACADAHLLCVACADAQGLSRHGGPERKVRVLCEMLCVRPWNRRVLPSISRQQAMLAQYKRVLEYLSRCVVR